MYFIAQRKLGSIQLSDCDYSNGQVSWLTLQVTEKSSDCMIVGYELGKMHASKPYSNAGKPLDLIQ